MGNIVLARNFSIKLKHGKIVSKEGQQNYLVSVEQQLWKQRKDQLKKC